MVIPGIISDDSCILSAGNFRLYGVVVNDNGNWVHYCLSRCIDKASCLLGADSWFSPNKKCLYIRNYFICPLSARAKVFLIRYLLSLFIWYRVYEILKKANFQIIFDWVRGSNVFICNPYSNMSMCQKYYERAGAI